MSVSELAPSDVSPAAANAAPSTRWMRVKQALFQPIDIGMLVFFRVAFGTIMLWEMYRYLSAGWVQRNYIEPAFHFTYWGFDWVRPWPGDGMLVHFWVMGALAVCIGIGFCYRAATALFFLGFAYIFLLDQTYYLNHFYLIVLISFLMIFLPAHRAASVDSWLRPQILSWTVPAWTLYLLRFQVGVAYLYGGFAKMNADWIAGEPMRSTLYERYLQGGFPLIGQWFDQEWMVQVFVWGGLLLDLLIVPALLWSRTRLPAYIAAVLFHLMNSILFNIGIFPWFMTAATLIFFPPDWMKLQPEDEAPEVETKKQRRKNKAPTMAVVPAVTSPPTRLTRGQQWTVGFLAVWVAVQTLMPFRHYLIPGNVSWTEEGHYYAWHMKLRRKRGMAMLYGVTAEGKRLDEPVLIAAITDGERTKLLTPRQHSKMAGRPLMIVQYAQHLAREWNKLDRGPIRIYADTMVSLNGREPQPLVDPQVDLVSVQPGWGAASWIMPLEKELRPFTADAPAAEPGLDGLEE